MDLNLKDKGFLVEGLWHAVDDAANNLEAVPRTIRRVIETEAWREREYRGRKLINASFLDFIVTKPLVGCGWPIDKVELLIKDDAATLALWREAITAPVGSNQYTLEHSDNVTTRDGRGNSLSYTVARLKRERRDLFDRVCAGELSANAAAIEAGFRKKPLKRCPQCGHEWR